jgi:hypothetical protein
MHCGDVKVRHKHGVYCDAIELAAAATNKTANRFRV